MFPYFTLQKELMDLSHLVQVESYFALGDLIESENISFDFFYINRIRNSQNNIVFCKFWGRSSGGEMKFSLFPPIINRLGFASPLDLLLVQV